MAQRTHQNWGYDAKNLDASVRPQDNFYAHVNNKWISTNPIPASEARWGGFQMLVVKTQEQLKAIVTELDTLKRVVPGSPEQMIRDLYRSGMDVKRRNALGAKPLTPWLAQIEKLKAPKDLLPFLHKMHALGLGFIWGWGIDQDAKNSDMYALHIAQGGLGLPDRDYYLKDDEESKRVLNGYRLHVQQMLKLTGMRPTEAKVHSDRVIELETALARISMTKEDRREPEKTYNKKTLAQLNKFTPDLAWNTFLKKIGANKVDYVIFMQTEFFIELEKMFESVSLDTWKSYLTFHMTSAFSPYLSETFVRTNFNFYGKVMSGREKIRPLWRRSLGLVDGCLGEQLGKLYVERHFSPEAKRKMNELVDDLFAAFEVRVKKLDWMSDATKKKALRKLHTMSRKIGYPDTWKSYRGLVISPTDLVGNVLRSIAYEQKRQLRKLGKPIDRDEWFMTPQTVNAYHSSNMNDIAFPAAMLQYPFFDMSSDEALNYGSIGWTIGHEITHGFDDQGAKFDEKGNMKLWWTPEDKEKFEAKTEIVRKQFDAYEIEGLHVNGQLTLGENIADLGGIAIAYDAYQRFLERHGRKDIDGLTPEQRFFYAFAQAECQNDRPEFIKMVVLSDPHSPNIFRVNGTISNTQYFYDVFDLKEGDKLYRKPEVRAKIW